MIGITANDDEKVTVEIKEIKALGKLPIESIVGPILDKALDKATAYPGVEKERPRSHPARRSECPAQEPGCSTAVRPARWLDGNDRPGSAGGPIHREITAATGHPCPTIQNGTIAIPSDSGGSTTEPPVVCVVMAICRWMELARLSSHPDEERIPSPQRVSPEVHARQQCQSLRESPQEWTYP